MRVEIAETGDLVGTLTVGPEAVEGDNHATQTMAEAYMARLTEAYDPLQARAYWDGWSNGYWRVTSP